MNGMRLVKTLLSINQDTGLVNGLLSFRVCLCRSTSSIVERSSPQLHANHTVGHFSGTNAGRLRREYPVGGDGELTAA